MKKIIAAFLSLALLTGVLAGCSDNNTDTPSNNSPSVSEPSSSEQTEQSNIDKALALINTLCLWRHGNCP